MRALGTIHHIEPSSEHRLTERIATRAIVLKDHDILLLYTGRYDDYSLPGGGVEAGEVLETALQRELAEETGARDIKIIAPFGVLTEYRPWYKDNFDALRMVSYCYVCEIGSELSAQQLEPHEVQNGMQVRWLNIHQAIAHNESVMQQKPASMGLSIVRETLLLRQIVQYFALEALQAG